MKRKTSTKMGAGVESQPIVPKKISNKRTGQQPASIFSSSITTKATGSPNSILSPVTEKVFEKPEPKPASSKIPSDKVKQI